MTRPPSHPVLAEKSRKETRPTACLVGRAAPRLSGCRRRLCRAVLHAHWQLQLPPEMDRPRGQSVLDGRCCAADCAWGFHVGVCGGEVDGADFLFSSLGAWCRWAGDRGRQRRGCRHTSGGHSICSSLCIYVLGYLYTRLKGLGFVCIARHQLYINILLSSKHRAVTPKAYSPTHLLHLSFVLPDQRKDDRAKRRAGARQRVDISTLPRYFAQGIHQGTCFIVQLFFLAGLVTSAFNKEQAQKLGRTTMPSVSRGRDLGSSKHHKTPTITSGVISQPLLASIESDLSCRTERDSENRGKWF